MKEEHQPINLLLQPTIHATIEIRIGCLKNDEQEALDFKISDLFRQRWNV